VTHGLGDDPLLVDASFVLGVLFRVPSAVRFTGALARAKIVDVNLGEVFYKAAQVESIAPKEVASVLAAQGLGVVPVGISAAMRFPALKQVDVDLRESQRRQDRPEKDVKSLSLADIACLSVAIDRGIPVLTGDRHWKTLGLPLRIEDFRDPDLLP
jgi:PIN domain nuclease of toxin-antitoxin system